LDTGIFVEGGIVWTIHMPLQTLGGLLRIAVFERGIPRGEKLLGFLVRPCCRAASFSSKFKVNYGISARASPSPFQLQNPDQSFTFHFFAQPKRAK